MKKRYPVPIGYSDHSAKIETSIAAAALGAEILEFHAVFDRNSNGPDASSSLEMEEIKTLVCAVKNISIALNNSVDKGDNSKFLELKNIFEKSLAVNKDLPADHIIKYEDLEAKKPKGFGMDASKFQEIIGKKINRSKGQWDFLNYTDLED